MIISYWGNITVTSGQINIYDIGQVGKGKKQNRLIIKEC